MSEKLYKPIIKDGDHLVRSTTNPDRYRGQTRDADNKNPDIVEWEEVVVDDIVNDTQIASRPEEKQVRLTPAQEEFAAIMSKMIADAVEDLTGRFLKGVVEPWWKYKAWPVIRRKGRNLVDAIKGNNLKKSGQSTEKIDSLRELNEYNLENVSTQIDDMLDETYIDMSEEEVQQHIMKIIYLMLELTNEIRILSNARIRNDNEDEQEYLEKTHRTEKMLTERVSCKINELLSNENLKLDIDSYRQIFSLFDGGVRLNGEYVPVDQSKVYNAMLSQKE